MMQRLMLYMILLTLLSGCLEEYPDDCKGYVSHLYKKGNVRADGNYIDLDDYAVFIDRRKSAGDTWEYDYTKQAIFFETINEYCIEKMFIYIKNVRINSRDTMYVTNIKYGTGVSDTEVAASLSIIDYDVSYEDYKLHTEVDYNNWIKIDYVSKDRKEIRGTFELNFISTYEPYLTGERERWDDPDRPNILRFTNGEFTAKYSEIFEK